MDSNNFCHHCKKPNLDPGKKCAKSHSRCKGRIFCDKNCEKEFHCQKKNSSNKTESKEEKTPEIDENRLKIEAEMKREAKKANPNKNSIQRKNKSRFFFYVNNEKDKTKPYSALIKKNEI